MDNMPDNRLPRMIYLRVLETLDKAKKSLITLKAAGLDFDQLSVIGRTPEETGTTLLTNFTKLCGPSVGLGILHIPNVGKTFVAGSLSSLLLNIIDGKALGSIEGGLLGIFEGYGVETKASLQYISHLKNGKFLVIVKGNATELKLLKDVLN